MSIIEFKDLASLREKHKNEKIVFCSGTFDLTHAGHVLFLEDCKKHGDIVIVAVGNDFNQRIYGKGKGRPVQNEHIRLKMVSSLKPVDYALLDINAKNNDILATLIDFFDTLKPDVYIINQDAFDIPKRRKLIEGFPIKMLILERSCPHEFDGISATKLIKKIKTEVEK